MKKGELYQKLDEFIYKNKLDEKSKGTCRKYKNDVKMFIDTLPDDKDVSKEDVIAYKEKICSEQYSESTIDTKITSINKFFKYCGLEDLKVKHIKIQRTKSLNNVISVADYKRLLRHAKASNDMMMYMIMKVLAETGIRIEELKYFTVENLGFYIKVKNKGKTREIIVRQDLLRELRKYCRENNIRSGPIFVNRDTKKQYANVTIWRRMKKIAGRAHVKKTLVHPHSFRHLFAIQYLEQNNNNIVELADILGHENLETTRIYTRTTNDMKRKKLESMKY